MVTFEKNDKKLVIPSALGNFGVAGGSTGSGITPEQAAEISSAITEAAIEEYDIDMQADLGDIRENVSAVTEGLATLSGITAALSAATEEAGQAAATNAENISTLSGATDTIIRDMVLISAATDNLAEAVETLTDGLSAYTTNDTYTQGIQGVQGQISGLSEGVAELSAFTSGLSFTVREQSQNLEQLSGATVAVEQAVSGKQDTLSAGNGIEISGATISVKAGEGLGFSGDTIVVSGGTDGGPAVYYLDEMTQQERVALFNEIFQYDEFTFPAGNYRFFVTNRDNDEYQGRFELFVARFYDETPVSFSGVIQSRYNSTILQRGYELSSDGSFYKNFENNLNIGSVPSISSVSFGNDSRGGLTYDADNGYFIYDSNNVATGDTQNYCEDLIDYLFLTSLFNRNGRYENYYLINVHSFDVISGGTTYHYTAPTLSIRDITSYTIGDYTFQKEVTFKYSDWVLRIDIPDVNIGANIRISAV